MLYYGNMINRQSTQFKVLTDTVQWPLPIDKNTWKNAEAHLTVTGILHSWSAYSKLCVRCNNSDPKVYINFYTSMQVFFLISNHLWAILVFLYNRNDIQSKKLMFLLKNNNIRNILINLFINITGKIWIRVYLLNCMFQGGYRQCYKTRCVIITKATGIHQVSKLCPRK
jgi:hypothetical protein